MYFEDLQLVYYHHGPLDADEWSVPLLAVGWLEGSHPYSRGEVSSKALSKFEELVEQAHEVYSQRSFRGLHVCSLCPASNSGPHDSVLVGSHRNLFVPGKEVVYAAPAGMAHYIAVHGYKPPDDFVHHLLRCPDARTAAYRAALREANAGVEPPLETDKPFVFDRSKIKPTRVRADPRASTVR